MKILVGFLKVLFYPLILVGGGLVWFSVHNWTAGTASSVVDGTTILSERPKAAIFRDSVSYDLARCSLRQDNVVGIKSPARAVFVAWTGKDTGLAKLVVVSSDPRFLGPVVKSFQKIDSAEGEIKVRSTGTGSAGNLQAQFDALVQILAVKLGNALDNPVRGRVHLDGVALLRTDSSLAGISGVAPEFWEIHTDGVPSADAVHASLGGGLAAIALALGLQVAIGRRERRERDEEEEEHQNEQPLV